MYVGEKHYNLIDSELGRFLRKFTEFELFLRNIAISVDHQLTWNEASVLRISDLLKVWVGAQHRFPAHDREAVGRYLRTADEVVKLRHLAVHGRWYGVDPDRGEFIVELPLTKSAARRFDIPATWPKGAHPATVMPMNPATIARAWRGTEHLVNYIGENLERWEEHFRSEGP